MVDHGEGMMLQEKVGAIGLEQRLKMSNNHLAKGPVLSASSPPRRAQ